MSQDALVTVRLALAVIPLALLIALPSRFRRRFALCAAPLVLALVAYQWITFGNPFTTGYDYYVSGRSFSPGYAVADNPRGDGPWVFPDVLNGRLLQSACPCPLGGPQAGLPNVWFYPAVLLGLFWVLAPPLATVPGLVWAVRRRFDRARPRGAPRRGAEASWCLVPDFYQATRCAAPA